LSVEQLFEETTPALISDEAAIGTDADLYDEDMAADLTPEVLLARGVNRLTSVSVPADYAEVLLALRKTRDS